MQAKNLSDVAYERLRQVIQIDKGAAIPEKLKGILQSELHSMLGNFFDIAALQCNLEYDAEGELYLTLEAKVDAIKSLGLLK